MITPQLIDYINQQIAAGRNRENITESLKSSGWIQEDINNAFLHLVAGTSTSTVNISLPESVNRKRNFLFMSEENKIIIAEKISNWGSKLVILPYLAYLIFHLLKVNINVNLNKLFIFGLGIWFALTGIWAIFSGYCNIPLFGYKWCQKLYNRIFGVVLILLGLFFLKTFT